MFDEIICKECKTNFKGKKKDARVFCSRSCSAKYSNRNRKCSEETKNKIRNTLKKPDMFISCSCGTIFKYDCNHPNKKNCSYECSYKYKNKEIKDVTREKLSIIAKNRHLKKDINFGWQKRNNLKPSYPESIAIRFFEENKILFEREVKIDKYFADFIIFGKTIIEIDGSQHSKPERIISDNNKDKLLTKLGYDIIRIKYPSQNIRYELKNTIGILAQRLEQFSYEE